MRGCFLSYCLCFWCNLYNFSYQTKYTKIILKNWKIVQFVGNIFNAIILFLMQNTQATAAQTKQPKINEHNSCAAFRNLFVIILLVFDINVNAFILFIFQRRTRTISSARHFSTHKKDGIITHKYTIQTYMPIEKSRQKLIIFCFLSLKHTTILL